jgi:hypothetical protein
VEAEDISGRKIMAAGTEAGKRHTTESGTADERGVQLP